MAGPFYNAIKGTTSGTPGTGAFTPNAASAGHYAWSTVPAGWIGLVRFDDGAAHEFQYSYWNGTTLSRSATTQFVSSSTGSALTLTSAATAAMIADAADVQPHLGSAAFRAYIPNLGAATLTALGLPSATIVGTAASMPIASTNALAQMPSIQCASATTANALAGIHAATTVVGVASSAAGQGGWEFTARFGATQIPTGNRIFIGMTAAQWPGTAEPSAFTSANVTLAKDSTDTNLQLLTNASGAGTKIDTGIPFVINAPYDLTLWQNPGSLTCYMLLIRLDTGAIFYGSTAADVPANNTTLFFQSYMGLSGTTGTATNMRVGAHTIRTGT